MKAEVKKKDIEDKMDKNMNKEVKKRRRRKKKRKKVLLVWNNLN